jgi:hypothetical protein
VVVKKALRRVAFACIDANVFRHRLEERLKRRYVVAARVPHDGER